MAFPYANSFSANPTLQLLRQDFEQLERNRSVIQTPMKIGDRSFEYGSGTHSVSHIRVRTPEPIDRFTAWVGVDNNPCTDGQRGSVVFSAVAGGNEVFRSPMLHGGDAPVRVDVKMPPTAPTALAPPPCPSCCG